MHVLATAPPRPASADDLRGMTRPRRRYNVEDCAVAVPVGEEEEPLHYEAFRERDDEMISI